MIKYSLTCAEGHVFESWFQSGAAFETLRDSGRLSCTTCGSTEVTKTVMAPAVSKTAAPDTPSPAAPTPEQALQALRSKVEAEADYVGTGFAAEARAIHDGTAPERAIYGEATGKDAKALLQDGVPVLPLPFVPKKKAH